MAAVQTSRVVVGAVKLPGSAAVLRSEPLILSRSESSGKKVARKSRKLLFAPAPTLASASGISANDNEQDERALSMMRIPSHMAAGLGAFQSVTLEKTGLDLSAPEVQSEARTDDNGGDGGNGKNINNGGGGDGDDGDDDDYFDDGDDEGDGDGDGFFSRRIALPELFDRTTINAVLQEWYRTIAALPAGIRQAVEMGLVSSAQLVRFLSLDCRPTVVRAITRLPLPTVAREATGRMMADPGFVYKAVMEQLLTAGTAFAWEASQRKDRLVKEWDQVLASVATQCAANALTVWALAPSRSFGVQSRSTWQNALQQLPNNVFDKSGPLRDYTLQRRVTSFVYKAAELSAAGCAAGALGGALSNGLVSLRRLGNPNYESSTPVPSIPVSALGYGAFMGVSSNLRYQLLAGLDRAMSNNFNSMGLVVTSNVLFRWLNIRLGESSRLQWLGYKQEVGETNPLEAVKALKDKATTLAAKFTSATAGSSEAETVAERRRRRRAARAARVPALA